MLTGANTCPVQILFLTGVVRADARGHALHIICSQQLYKYENVMMLMLAHPY